MLKPLLTFFTFLVFAGAVNAQSGGLIYYLKNSGKLVASKDSADYSMVVLPPDTSVDKNLYLVREYYKNGKLMLMTSSRTNDVNLRYEGNYLAYFMNGHRSKMGTVVNGELVGNETSYYPNGKLYTIINYLTDDDNPGKKREFLRECRDSTGKVLTANGSGHWIEFDPDFKNITAEGTVDRGDKVSMWDIRENGHWIKGENHGDEGPQSLDDTARSSIHSTAKVMPQFPGGLDEFNKFLLTNIRYPAVAREQGTQGKVIVSFVVEVDGSIIDAHVVRGIGAGCDEEALRVILLMPKWKPAIRDGKPARLAFSVPINFGLTGNRK
ncbi:MAG: TonB family protein [Bacteroidota bacterium]|nr:TonB family protein [Bacteroidota bacterium]